MIKLTIIGSGNVTQHLLVAFRNIVGIEIVNVFARDKNNINHLIENNKIVSDFNDLLTADLFIIAVSDDVIEQVSNQILFTDKLVVHTSGGVSIDVLNNKNRKGVFYPLQSFTKNRAISFSEIPICIEANNENDYLILKNLAELLSKKVYKINSAQRKSLHISAVFVNNFVNHLYKIGNDICNENEVDFDILKPLILETANKIMTISPHDAQTGPAKRNDSTVINSQLDFLSNHNQKEIYKILTHSIQQNGKEL